MGPATVLFLLTRVDCIDGVAAYLESLVTGLHARGDRVVIVSGEVTTTGGSLARREAIAAASADWIVLEGLKDGEQVVVDGFQKMQGPPGMTVKPVPWSATTQPASAAPAAK